MKSLIAFAAAAALAIPATAFAQQANNPAGNGAMQQQYNAQNVTKAKPFGDIDVTAALGANANVSAWAGKLTAQQRAELSGRCAFITAHQADYEANATTFCTSYTTWDKANPAR